MKAHTILGAAAGVFGALSPVASPRAAASPAADAAAVSTAGSDSRVSDAALIKQLEQRLDERDAVIRDLMARVQRLESHDAARGGAPSGPSAPQQAQAAPPPPAAGAAGAPPAVAQVSPPGAPGAPGAPKPGPGQFEVSEEAAQRALERALVQTGAALLPAGKFEFVPSVTYQYQRISSPGQIVLTTEGTVLITENLIRATQVQANALVRMGLPWGMQLEVGLPYDYKDTTLVVRAGGAGLTAAGPGVSGIGDPSVALTKQLLVENDQRPGLFANIAYNPNVGQVKQTIPLGKGFNSLTAGITAVKRQDPLVFTGGFSYVYSWENKGVRPGDQYIASFGLLLAVSPETSLRFGQDLIFYGKDSFNGRALPGSNRKAGIFDAGIVTVLGRNRVISFSIGIGETQDAPDFVVQLAMPIRLN
jgi:hypothetical protein